MNSFRERVILPRKSFRINKLIWNFFFKLIRPLRINLIAISMLLNHKKESRSNISHKHIIKCRFAVRAVIEVSRKKYRVHCIFIEAINLHALNQLKPHHSRCGVECYLPWSSFLYIDYYFYWFLPFISMQSIARMISTLLLRTTGVLLH